MARKNSWENIYTRFIEAHGDRYDYSKVNYVDAKTKVTVVCNEHGEFLVSPSKHYDRGHGCPQCAGRSGEKLTKSSFIKRAKVLHKERYNYTKILDKPKSRSKVTIICQAHGEFEQRVDLHLSGSGCPDCVNGDINERASTFIQEATSVHANKYSYAKVKFTGIDNKVIITCPIHGDFEQSPYHHLKGQNCPKCSSRGKGFKPAGKAILYYLRIDTDDGEVLYKIGITGGTVSTRYSASELAIITVLSVTHYEIGREAFNEEQEILKQNEMFLYTGPAILKSGNTELFVKDVLNKDIKKDTK